MIYIVDIVIILIVFYFLKGGSSSPNQAQAVTVSSTVIRDARLALHLPNEIPVNWASSHSGMMHVGSTAIVNSECIMYINFEGYATKKREIFLNEV